MNALEFIYSLKDLFSRPARDMEQALKKFNQAEEQSILATNRLARSGALIRAPFERAGSVLSGFARTARTLAVAGGIALGGLALAGYGIKQVIDAAGYKEQQLIAFTAMLGSGANAANVYAHAVHFAAITPFETPEVVEATKQLLAYGFATKDLEGVLTSAGNLASGMGKPLSQAVEAFAALKEGSFGHAFGVGRGFSLLGISRQELEANGLKFDRRHSYVGSVADAMRVVQAIIGKRFGDGMKQQSESIFGLASTLQSRPFELFSSIFDNKKSEDATQPLKKLMLTLADLTDFSKPPGSKIQAGFKAGFGRLLDAVLTPLNKLLENGGGERIINQFFKGIDTATGWLRQNGPGIAATAKAVFDTIGGAFRFLIGVLRVVGPFIPTLLKLWAGLYAATGLLYVVNVIQKVFAVLNVLRVALFLVAGPWGYLVIALIAGAVLVAANWKTIGPFLARVWQWVLTAVKNVFAALKFVFLNFTPLGLLIKNWNPIIAWFKTLPNIFATLGSNIMNGLLNGIKSGIGAVTGAVKGVADSVIGIFSGPKGIDAHSPSRVFARLGSYIPAGLELGILGGRSRVKAAIGAISAVAAITAGPVLAHSIQPAKAGTVRARPAQSGDAQPTKTAHITINFNNTQAPGAVGARETSQNLLEEMFDALERAGFEVGD